MTTPVNILSFITEVLRNPETEKPYDLFPAQTDFLRPGFTLTPEGRFPFPEMCFGAIKKSGKTTTAAMAAIYALVVGGPFAEVIIAANDYEQAQSRVFQQTVRIIEASPLLRRDCKITATRIEYLPTGASIIAIANDYRGAAGANPTLTIIDEPWGIISESSHRLWDELVPSPARTLSGRLCVSYAGWRGESDVLWKLYERGIAGEEIAPSLYASPGLLLSWHRTPIAPWQSAEWVEQMRGTLRPNAFARMICNEWTSSESAFIDMEQWDENVNPAAVPLLREPGLSVVVGIDASVKRDSTAIVATAWDRQAQKVRLVWHRIFQPSPREPLDFEATIQATVLELRQRFHVVEVTYDPYQMVASAQRLTAAGVPMVEFPQTVPNLTEASQTLFDLIRGRRLILYPDDAMRLAASRAVAIEGVRGWRIAKEKQSHKIDVIVALAQSALGSVRLGAVGPRLKPFARAAAGPLVPDSRNYFETNGPPAATRPSAPRFQDLSVRW
jgi:hypothetical protein